MEVGDKIRRKLNHKETAIVIGVHENGRHLWVQGHAHQDGCPWTSNVKDWEPVPDPEPEVGDIWGTSQSHYRILGVDHKRGVMHICPVSDFHDPTKYPTTPGWIQLDTRDPHVFTREFPANNPGDCLKLVERP